MQLPTIKRFDLQAKHAFYVKFDDFFNNLNNKNNNEQALLSQQTKDLKSMLKDNKSALSYLVKGFDRSDIMIQAGNDINIGAIKIGTLGSVDIQDFNVEFYPDSNLLAEKLYYCWLGHMMDSATGLKYPRQYYERDIVIYTYDREVIGQASSNVGGIVGAVTGVLNAVGIQTNSYMETLITDPKNYKEKRTYRLCYPATIEKLQFNTEDSGFMEGINITFACNGGVTIEYPEIMGNQFPY